jgi:hypothetical protein
MTAASAVAREHAGKTAYVIISPSGNAECDAMIAPGDLMDMRCSITKFTPHLPRPASAHCDWFGGSLYSIAPTGKGHVDSFCDAIIDIPPHVIHLAYGHVWHAGAYSCLSSYIALICVNTQGHGVFLSYQGRRAF